MSAQSVLTDLERRTTTAPKLSRRSQSGQVASASVQPWHAVGFELSVAAVYVYKRLLEFFFA